MTGYWMKIEGSDARAFLGTTPNEVAEQVKHEIEAHEDMRAEDIDAIEIHACDVTQEQIDAMPDFHGF